MFSILLKLKRKIKRLLKVQTETRQKTSTSFQSKTFKFLLLLLFSVLVGVFYQAEALYDPLDMPRSGEIALEGVLAPFRFTVYKTERELREDHDDTRQQIPFYIDYDMAVAQSASDNLKKLITLVDSLQGVASFDSSLQSDSGQVPKTTQLNEEHVNIISQRFSLLSKSSVELALLEKEILAVNERLSDIYKKNIYDIGVLPDQYSFPETKYKNVIIRRGESQRIYSRDKLYTVSDANLRLLTVLNNLNSTDSINVEFYFHIGRTFIEPNLSGDIIEYNQQVEEALTSISNVKEVIEQNHIIIRTGQKVSVEQERILQEMVRIQRTQAEKKGWYVSFLPMFARILLIFAAFSMLYLFMYFFRKDIFKSNPKLLALFLVFILQLFIIHLEGVQGELSIYLYLVAILPIMITILFDAEVGILSTVVLAMILGILNRFDFTLALMTLTIGTVACFTSRRVRKRTDFFKIIYSVSFTFAVFILLVETLKLTPNTDILTEAGFGIVNGIVTSFVVMGLLPVFESIFGITTDITLLELSDLNHPLLKRLSLEAPGTYHHSIIVGTLTEAAAKEIGGNSLLARVGAYFHDIGKIEIPEYFVENQLSVKSKHEELTPSMSSIILSSHVKKGRLLGEEFDIPDDVLNFIEEHHGTMIQSYFYNKAKEQGMGDIPDDKFRYPGPRPQTRETGIAMLADAVEAASRTLENPKPARINNLIQRIINDRFESGELDECPLTLKDLAKIKEAFSMILIGTFHQRIAYPKKENEAD